MRGGRYLTGVLTTAVPALRLWIDSGRGPMKMMGRMKWKRKLLQWGWLSPSLLGAPLAPVPAP